MDVRPLTGAIHRFSYRSHLTREIWSGDHIFNIMKLDSNCKRQKAMLKEVRKKLGLTQGQLASYLGVHRDNWNKYENGGMEFEWIEKAIKLQGVLKQAGYSIEDLANPSDQQSIVNHSEN